MCVCLPQSQYNETYTERLEDVGSVTTKTYCKNCRRHLSTKVENKPVTLAQRNATKRTHQWPFTGEPIYTLETRYAVGHNGTSRYRGTTGGKMHLLVLDVVTEEHREHKPGTYKVGDVFQSSGLCGGNGQNTAHAVAGLDVDAVTCSKCLARMGGR